MMVRSLAAAMIALAVLTGCSAAPAATSAGFFFPQHNSPLGEGDMAGVAANSGAVVVAMHNKRSPDFGDVMTGWGEYDLLGPSAFMTAS